MKYTFFRTGIIVCLATFVLQLTHCTKDRLSPVAPAMDTVDSTAPIKFLGSFNNGPYGSVSGQAKIYLSEGRYSLVLDNVNISNGPDLHVYLSKEVMPISFIDLGKIKSTTGRQVYEISGAPDFSLYKYALIHCQQYNHLFGSAELK